MRLSGWKRYNMFYLLKIALCRRLLTDKSVSTVSQRDAIATLIDEMPETIRLGRDVSSLMNHVLCMRLLTDISVIAASYQKAIALQV